MKTILVATDFSPAALNAANYAVHLAPAIDADIYLLHTYQIPVSYGQTILPTSVDDMELIAEKDMAAFEEQLDGNKGDKLNIKTEVRLGTFFQELKTVCEQIKPYVVVMGSQGTTATERFLFGTHAVYAMKNLQWPLITVPTCAGFSAIKKIALATDLAKVVETTPIDEIKMLVKDFNAELHILNTGNESEFDPDIVFESGLLQELLAEFKPQYHFIANENTDEGILDFVEKNDINLLIVLPKRHNLLDKLVHKSHTKELVLHSQVPVMALH